MPDICRDKRFEVIAEYKKRLIEGTNIESRPEEMAVIDSILFRFWQMGWLHASDVEPKRMTGVWLEEEATDDGNWRYTCSVCGYADIQSRSAQVPYCWHCGSRMQKMDEEADNGTA